MKKTNRRKHLLFTGIQVVMDLSLLLSAFIAAYLLRFDFHVPPAEVHKFITQMPFVILLQFVALTLTGARASIWRYTGLGHIRLFLYAALGSWFVVALLRLTLPEAHQAWRVPLSVNFIDVVLAFGGAFALRLVRRAEYEHHKRRVRAKEHVNGNGNGNGKINGNGNGAPKRRVLLIGAGRAGVLVAEEIEGSGDLDFEIKGFVDDDPSKLRRSVQGHKVLGGMTDLPRLVRSLGIDHVIITMAQASGTQIQRIVKICEDIPIKV